MRQGLLRNPNYRQPPKEHQFKKGGPSPNPSGRPKNSENIGTIVDQELNRVITVFVNGNKMRRTVREALLDVLIDLAMKGNQRAIDLILELTAEKRKPDDRPRGRMVIDGYDVDSPEHQARQARRDKGTCYDPEFSWVALRERNADV